VRGCRVDLHHVGLGFSKGQYHQEKRRRYDHRPILHVFFRPDEKARRNQQETKDEKDIAGAEKREEDEPCEKGPDDTAKRIHRV